MDTVAWVADVAGGEVYTGNVYDHSGFHNLSRQPESWPVFPVSYAGTD